MRRLVALFVVVLVCIATLINWLTTPGEQERHFRQVQTGMAEKDVQDIMGSEGESAGKKYAITGDDRQRAWVSSEKGRRIEMVVVFDKRAKVARKESWTCWTVLNYLGE